MATIEALSIRAATPDDLDVVDRLFQRSYPRLLRAQYPPSVCVTTIPILARAQPALLRSGTYFLAEREGRVVGAGGWTPALRESGRASRLGVGHVRHVVTDHRHLRRGIGRRLLAHVMTDARRAGMAELRCQSTLTAAPFYRALGFEEVGPLSVELPRGIAFASILMRRPI
ncbi:Acetyltransferase (GNAT) family protein [Roseivivax jejudonensis]|uniref:Acetyltransferase (GNAT) family protein n=1 Tax=Roseivivax jejudonensis TaxID=1529041 RepID=A0A1X6ZCW0_9RHOB|nr:GNAT family N-acetyltransferase [Roseivivax jejudonensis]SLN47363.1 Acetyltransferase (GNAT) family protein [Roseivivax jejudonensis]